MSDAPAPTALIVHAHPEPGSFSTAQMRTATRSLQQQGYTVQVIDLYADQWSPVLDRQEFGSPEGPFKPQAEQMRAVEAGRLDPVVAEHLAKVLEADLLVLSFPLWWFSLPAVLKGWVDRVFVMGALFGGEYGLFEEAASTGKKAMLLLTTGGSQESFAGEHDGLGRLEDFLYHVHRGMLEFVGYRVLDPVVTFGPAHLSQDERAAALIRAGAAVSERIASSAAAALEFQNAS